MWSEPTIKQPWITGTAALPVEAHWIQRWPEKAWSLIKYWKNYKTCLMETMSTTKIGYWFLHLLLSILTEVWHAYPYQSAVQKSTKSSAEMFHLVKLWLLIAITKSSRTKIFHFSLLLGCSFPNVLCLRFNKVTIHTLNKPT